MKLEQIDHVALKCSSVEATKVWYVKTLGFTHVHQGLWDGVPVVLALGSTYLTLFPLKENEALPAGGLAWHLALRVSTYADFMSAQADLERQAIKFQFRDYEIAHSVYLTDPDGFLLEITTYDVPGRKNVPSEA